MNAFAFHQPRSVDEAVGLLAQHGDGAVPLAGGTSLLLRLKDGLARPSHVVGLQRIEALRGIRTASDGGLEIGALVSHREAERSDLVRRYCPALAAAFGSVATVRIRDQATVGGSVASADPGQDPPAMLLALSAAAVVSGRAGERLVSLDEMFVGPFETSLDRGEVVTALRLPPQPAGLRATYVKFLPRTSDDYATVGVAIALQLGESGVCRAARIALCGAGPTALRARRAEAALAGGRLDRPLIAGAAELVREEVDPAGDVRGSASYKRDMAGLWTERALRSLLS